MMTNQYSDRDTTSFLISINTIRDKYFEGEKLEEDEHMAMINYDRFRLLCLRGSKDEADFDRRYFQLQVMANAQPFTDFIHYKQIPSMGK